MTVFQATDFDNHQEVRFFNDPDSGLRAIIAVHRRGPENVAGGGVRMKAYDDENDAIADALRLLNVAPDDIEPPEAPQVAGKGGAA